MYVVLILTFFSMLFWSFFEQAGSSLNNFTDRNVDRFFSFASLGKPDRIVAGDDVGQTIHLQPTQKQLGYFNGDQAFTMDALDKLREENKERPDFEIDWKVTKDDVGMESRQTKGRDSRQHVPVDQRDLHSRFRPGVHGPVGFPGGAKNRAEHDRQSSPWGSCSWVWVSWHSGREPSCMTRGGWSA